jgi:ectoine hydroxylase-related dioxygenase (phytanoyl-CoA dioxygenase family)
VSGAESQDQAVAEFGRHGFVVLRSVLTAEEATLFRDLAEDRYRQVADDDPETDRLRGGVCLMRVFEAAWQFRDLMEREPVISLVERLLGDDCHVISQNVLRTPPPQSIVNWHIDDAQFFPFTGLDRVPVFSLSAMVLLSDVDEERFGPTQVVPGSHLLGHEPPYTDQLPPQQQPLSLLARAGDCYLVNSQTWHRGAPNTSERTRYLLTTAYGRRFISQRFYPFLNYRMPQHVLDGASTRLRRLLGAHGKGPYG